MLKNKDYEALADVFEVCFRHIRENPSEYTKEELDKITIGNGVLSGIREKDIASRKKSASIIMKRRKIDRGYGRTKDQKERYKNDGQRNYRFSDRAD